MKLKKSEIAAISLCIVMAGASIASLCISRSYDAVSNPMFIQEKEISESAESDKLININTASKEELCLLPDIGPKTAEKIIAFRDKYGPFSVKSDILDVNGIGIKTYNKLSDLITS